MWPPARQIVRIVSPPCLYVAASTSNCQICLPALSLCGRQHVKLSELSPRPVSMRPPACQIVRVISPPCLYAAACTSNCQSCLPALSLCGRLHVKLSELYPRSVSMWPPACQIVRVISPPCLYVAACTSNCQSCLPALSLCGRLHVKLSELYPRSVSMWPPARQIVRVQAWNPSAR